MDSTRHTTPPPVTSLIAFHRVLIGFGIAFCLGYAAWELVTWWVTRSGGALAVGLLFLVLGAALGVYLSRLRSVLGYDRDVAATPDR